MRFLTHVESDINSKKSSGRHKSRDNEEINGLQTPLGVLLQPKNCIKHFLQCFCIRQQDGYYQIMSILSEKIIMKPWQDSYRYGHQQKFAHDARACIRFIASILSFQNLRKVSLFLFVRLQKIVNILGLKITRQTPLGWRERKLGTISWYTEIYFERACANIKDERAFWFHSRLLFVEHSNIHHATVKAKVVTVKAVRGTCLRTNWCEVLLLHKSQHKEKFHIYARQCIILFLRHLKFQQQRKQLGK